MAGVTITVRKNGPYLVSGPVEVRHADGNVSPAKETVALCRCGASTEKPFRDGTHSKGLPRSGSITAHYRTV